MPVRSAENKFMKMILNGTRVFVLLAVAGVAACSPTLPQQRIISIQHAPYSPENQTVVMTPPSQPVQAAQSQVAEPAPAPVEAAQIVIPSPAEATATNEPAPPAADMAAVQTDSAPVSAYDPGYRHPTYAYPPMSMGVHVPR